MFTVAVLESPPVSSALSSYNNKVSFEMESVECVQSKFYTSAVIFPGNFRDSGLIIPNFELLSVGKP